MVIIELYIMSDMLSCKCRHGQYKSNMVVIDEFRDINWMNDLTIHLPPLLFNIAAIHFFIWSLKINYCVI